MTGDGAIVAAGAPASVGSYPHARRVGDLLFLSGIGPRPADGGPVDGVTVDAAGDVVDYDFESQCHAVFGNVRAVLDAAGATLDDLVDVTVFLTDIRADFATYNRIYAQYLDATGPCRTTVEVSRLPTPIAIELKCVAYLGKT